MIRALVLQAVFLDTPGIIDRRNDKLEERMMAAVQQAGCGGWGWVAEETPLWLCVGVW